MRFHRNMHVMALTANAGLRLRAGEMCVVLSLSPIPFFTFVVILSRCSPLFFCKDVMLCTSVTHIIMTIAVRAVMFGVGHLDITDEGDKKSFGIPTGSSGTSTRTRLGPHSQSSPVRHGSQRSEHLLCRTDLLINSTLRYCSFSIGSLAEMDSGKSGMPLLGSSAKRSKAFC